MQPDIDTGKKRLKLGLNCILIYDFFGLNISDFALSPNDCNTKKKSVQKPTLNILTDVFVSTLHLTQL